MTPGKKKRKGYGGKAAMLAHCLALLAGDPSERICHTQTINLAGSNMLRHSQQVRGNCDDRKDLHLAQIGLGEWSFRIYHPIQR
jgi:hypothetical protein